MQTSYFKDILKPVETDQQITEEEKELEEKTPDALVCIHNGEDVKTLDPDYLVNIFPEKLNQLTISPGVIFKFHFLSKSLYYWVEIFET